MQSTLLRNNKLSYSVRRFFVDNFFFRQTANLPAGLLVLDLGGHKFVKRGHFNIDNYDFRVVTANISTTKGTTVQADAGQIPFATDIFDVVICAELLEHVPDPRVVLSESYRVLRDGGKLLLTAPFLYRIHADPHDYGRYTGTYWRDVLNQIGYEEVRIERQGLFYSVLADFWKQRMNQKYTRRVWARALRWLIGKLLIFPLQRWALNHERQPRVQADPFLANFTTGFGIVAAKRIDRNP